MIIHFFHERKSSNILWLCGNKSQYTTKQSARFHLLFQPDESHKLRSHTPYKGLMMSDQSVPSQVVLLQYGIED